MKIGGMSIGTDLKRKLTKATMSGRKSKSKGYRNEKKIEQTLQSEGIDAKRMPLSGGAGGDFIGDIQIKGTALGEKVLAECKERNSGFKMIYDWLDDNTLLFIKQTRRDQLVVLRIEDLMRLMK
jgi:hypothetical protein